LCHGHCRASATPSPSSSVSSSNHKSVRNSAAAPGGAANTLATFGSLKSPRRFFQRRSFRPSSSSSSSASSQQPGGADATDATDAHSDSECTPGGYWSRRSLQRSFQSRDAWSNSLDFSSPFKIDGGAAASTAAAAAAAAAASDMRSLRGRLYLNFKPQRSFRTSSVQPSPDDDGVHDASKTTSSASFTETPTPLEGIGDSISTGTGTSGSHIDSDYSPATSGRCQTYLSRHLPSFSETIPCFLYNLAWFSFRRHLPSFF